MAQIPALTPLRKQMELAVNNLTSTNYSCSWDTADCTNGFYSPITTVTYPYSNVNGVIPNVTTSLTVLGEEEIDKKIDGAIGKLDEHVDQLEGDIEFFNEERQKQERKICHLEDENEILKDQCKTLRDEVEELGNKITTLRGDLMKEETKIDSRIAWLESIIEELQSLKEKIK